MIAACATAAGFLVLALSPVPMVRGFGLLLVVGIVVALLCALTLGVAGAGLAPRGRGADGARPGAGGRRGRRGLARRRRDRHRRRGPGGAGGRLLRGSGRRALARGRRASRARARDRGARSPSPAGGCRR